MVVSKEKKSFSIGSIMPTASLFSKGKKSDHDILITIHRFYAEVQAKQTLGLRIVRGETEYVPKFDLHP